MHWLYTDLRSSESCPKQAGQGCGEMRSYLPHYEMRAARNLGEVLELIARQPGEWKPFAGGTDLMVLLEQGKLTHRKFLSIFNIENASRIETEASHVSIGALATYSELQRSDVLQNEFPLLCRAAGETGSIANQNRGTLGGNIANASPAADSPPALLVYDAELELVSARGERWVAFHGFWKGYKKLEMRDDELIRRIRLPRNKSGWTHFYRKVGSRRAQAISKVCLAGTALQESGSIADVRIALGSAALLVLTATQ